MHLYMYMHVCMCDHIHNGMPSFVYLQIFSSFIFDMILLHLQQIVAFCHSRVTKIGSLRAFTAASGIYVNENRESETAGDNNTNAYNSACANKRVSEIECALGCVCVCSGCRCVTFCCCIENIL